MKRALTLLLLFASIGAFAADVSPILIDDQLGTRIDAMSFPDTLPKELTSGLTNRFYARVTLLDAQNVVDQRTVEIAIRYDLWDQQFSMVSSINGAVVESRIVARIEDVNALLHALRLPKLFDTASLPRARDLVLRVEVLLNPIDRERMRMIRKWVAQNRTPGLNTDQSISMSNAIFNRILEQYADGSDIAAVWRADAVSPAFRLDSLVNERR
jgi:hypothetical protein